MSYLNRAMKARNPRYRRVLEKLGYSTADMVTEDAAATEQVVTPQADPVPAPAAEPVTDPILDQPIGEPAQGEAAAAPAEAPEATPAPPARAMRQKAVSAAIPDEPGEPA